MCSSSLFLTKIFQQSLSTATVPDDWRIGKVIPVHKSSNKSSPLNYRPISLTSVPSKILEHIIHKNLSIHLDSISFFNKAQHGFRRNFSCETQLLCLTHDLFSNLDSGFPTDAVFLDFAKAFDKVPHNQLLLKLSSLNLDTNVLSWIKSFLSQRNQFVYANDSSSALAPVTSGVPQGTVLGPLLFLIYINDLPLQVSLSMCLFADDCVVYRKIASPSDSAALQSDLDSINEWCSNSQMSLNVNKCKHMRFTRSSFQTSSPLTLNTVPLQQTDTYKYIGVLLTKNLSWDSHINTVVSAANRSLGYLRRNFRSVPSNLKRLLYISLVRSKLEYASSIWHPHLSSLTDSIEAVQNRAARFIQSDYSRFSSVTQIKADLSLPLLATRRKLFRLCLLHKVYYSPLLHQTLLTSPTYLSSRLDHPKKIARPAMFLHSTSKLSSPRRNCGLEWPSR